MDIKDDRIDNDEIHIFAGNLHAHLLGRKVKGRLFRYRKTLFDFVTVVTV